MAGTTESTSKTAECFEFTWRRREKGPGFRWEWQRGRCLLVGPPDAALQSYEPLVEETGLFLTFAHLDGSDDRFLHFANTYGRLGTYHRYAPEGGEPLAEWQRHHRWMQFLADLRSDCLKNRRNLGRVVNWIGKDVIYWFPKIGTGSTESWRHLGQLRQCPRSLKGLPLFQPGDLRGPARWFLVYALNDWLIELEGWRTPIAPRLVWSEEHHRPQFIFRPSSLLGAMVCQFAAALHGAWPFNKCRYCRKFFQLAPGVNRANRRTCSPTCKQYLHNRRVQRARKLHAKGRTVGQIIKRLKVSGQGKKSSADIVRAWISR